MVREPILAKVPDREVGLAEGGSRNVFIAVGHGPWGIALSLGSGIVVAEMLKGIPTARSKTGYALKLEPALTPLMFIRLVDSIPLSANTQ